MNAIQTMLLILINLPLCIGIGTIFFKDWGEFWQGLRAIYDNRYDFSFLGWDRFGDSWGEMKVFLYLILIICSVFTELHYFAH